MRILRDDMNTRIACLAVRIARAVLHFDVANANSILSFAAAHQRGVFMSLRSGKVACVQTHSQQQQHIHTQTNGHTTTTTTNTNPHKQTQHTTNTNNTHKTNITTHANTGSEYSTKS